MARNDLYFIASTILGLLSLLGIDWKALWGKINVTPSPHRNILTPSPYRNILLVVLIIGSLIMSAVGWYKTEHQDRLRWSVKQDQEKVIYGKAYHDESVELDGRKFDQCTFDNVTLVYHALAPTDFVGCHFTTNTSYLTTDNDAAKGFMALSDALKQMNASTRSSGKAIPFPSSVGSPKK